MDAAEARRHGLNVAVQALMKERWGEGGGGVGGGGWRAARVQADVLGTSRRFLCPTYPHYAT